MGKLRCALLPLAVAALLGGPRAEAQPEDSPARVRARELAREGGDLYQKGYYREALERFRDAYRIYPTPLLHYNFAEIHSELGQWVEALESYERFTREVKVEERPTEWERAREQINRLQGQIATVQIQANVVGAKVTADGRTVGETPLAGPLRLMPGPHAIVVSRVGYERQVIEVRTRAGEVLGRCVTLETEDEAARRKAAYQRVDAERRASEERLRRAQEQSLRGRLRTTQILRTNGWISLGVGTALALVGGTFGILSARYARDVETVSADSFWHSITGTYDRALAYRKIAIACGSTGLAFTAAGGVLLWAAQRRHGADAREAGQPDGRRPLVTALPVAGPHLVGLVLLRAF
jgi:tetratricopeptide (TPR) repeat protein